MTETRMANNDDDAAAMLERVVITGNLKSDSGTTRPSASRWG